MNIPYGRQHITEEDIQAVSEVLRGDYLTQGPSIAQFEQAFASYVGAKFALAVSNGTTALHLAALALGVKPGTRVISTPITFAASTNCVLYCGGEVWFADIDPDSYTLSLDKTRALLASKPKGFFSGIIPVDFAGLPVNMEAFRALADEFGCWIIEDACHAPGASFKNTRNETVHCGDGHYADLSIFSFHPVKHIAAGEGGMITTNNEALYKQLVLLRTHGITKDAALFQNNPEQVEQGGWYYEMQELGFNYRITDFQAALANSQLKRADAGLAQRQKIAERYQYAFQHLPILSPALSTGVQHAWHLYVIQTEKRKALYDALREKQIFCQVHYIPVHLQPYYQQLGWKPGDFQVAEAYYKRCLSLPMYPSLTEEQQGHVITSVMQFFSGN